MATYSLAVTGAPASSVPLVASLVISDSSATVGGQQAAMASGAQVLCKNPDGSQSWYTFDTERSIPGVRNVLKPV